MQTYEKLDGHIHFRPAGDLTFFNIAPFTEAVSAAVNTTGIGKVILDCTEVGILDSAALGALVALAKKLNARDGCLKLANVRKSLRTGIAHARLESFFAVFDSAQKAISEDFTPRTGKTVRGTRNKP